MGQEQILRDIFYAVMPPDVFLIAIAMLLPFSFKAKIRVWIYSLSLLILSMSIPAIAKLASMPLLIAHNESVEDDNKSKDADVIVVLGGGIYSDLHDGYWLSEQSSLRAAAAKTIFDKTGLPIIVSGGNPNTGYPSEAETIAKQFSFPVTTILESKSMNTLENAVNTAKILRKNGWRNVFLVSSETHMLRARALFKAQGIEIVSILGVSESKPISIIDIIPSSSAFGMWRHLLKEYAGIVWYLVNGQVSMSDLSPN